MSSTGVPELESIAAAIEEKTAQLFHLRAGLNKLHGEIDVLMSRLETLTESEAEIASDAGLGKDLAVEFEAVAPAYVAMAVPANTTFVNEDEAREELVACESMITTLEDAVQSDALEEPAQAEVLEDAAQADLLEDAARAALLENAARAAMADQSDTETDAVEIAASDSAAFTPDDADDHDTDFIGLAQGEAVTGDESLQADNLLQIKGIEPETAEKLQMLGYSTFAAIADLEAVDVALIESALDHQVNVSKDNWIEQAALLSQGVATHYQECPADDAQTVDIPHEVAAETKLLRSPTHTAYVDAALVKTRKADVLHLFCKEIPTAEVVAAAQNGARHIGKKMMLVAAVAGLFIGVQTTKLDFMPLITTPQLALLTSCGKAVLAGDVTCASFTWSRI